MDTKGEDDFRELFVCDEPPTGVTYQVIRQEWSADYTERRILEVRLQP